MQPRRPCSSAIPSIGLIMSCVLLGPAVARGNTISTFDVSGQYSIELSMPAQGTFAGKLMLDTTSGALTAVAIKFDALATTFNNLSENGPTADNWELTAYDFISDKLELTFFPIPNSGSLVNLSDGVILSGQVLDNAGDIAIFQGLSGYISPSVTSGSPVPEPSPVALVGLAVLVLGIRRTRALKRKLRVRVRFRSQ